MWRRFFSTWSSAPEARPVLILTIVAALSLPGVTTRIYAADEVEAFSYLRSLWFDRDVSFDNEYRHFADTGVVHEAGFRLTFLSDTTDTGLRLNFSTIGCAVLWAPFYAVADAGVRLARWLGSTVEADGYSQPYIAAVCYGSAVYGWLALILSWLVARRMLDLAGEPRGAPAGLATWAVWTGTPLLFYMYVAPPFTHAISACVAALFLWVWLQVRDRWSVGGTALLCGIAAVMAMVREQDAFLAVGPALDFARTWMRRRDAALLRAAAVGALTGVLAYLPQALSYLAINGRLGPSKLVGRKMAWTAPHALGVLLSPEHGWLAWTPLAALALGGCLLVAVRRGRPAAPSDVRWIGLCLLTMVLSQVYVAGSVQSWTLAGAFGQRRLVVLTPILITGLAFLFASIRGRVGRLAAGLVVAACIWWNIGLMVQFGAGWMDRQQLELARNFYNTFVVVPQRLPDIAYRYVFERQRFYRPAPPPAPVPGR